MTESTIQSLIPEIIYDSKKTYPHNVIQQFLDVTNELNEYGYRLEIIDIPVHSGKFTYCLTVHEKVENGWRRVIMPTEPGVTSNAAMSLHNVDKANSKEWINADVLYELMKRNNFVPGTYWWQWYFFGN